MAIISCNRVAFRFWQGQAQISELILCHLRQADHPRIRSRQQQRCLARAVPLRARHLSLLRLRRPGNSRAHPLRRHHQEDLLWRTHRHLHRPDLLLRPLQRPKLYLNLLSDQSHALREEFISQRCTLMELFAMVSWLLPLMNLLLYNMLYLIKSGDMLWMLNMKH